MSDDWLDTTPDPPKGGLPAVVELPQDYKARLALVESCWEKLTIAQRTFLSAWRENRYNARAANRQLNGRDHTNSAHTQWMREPAYATVVQVWRAHAASAALDRDRLLARQDDIVETLLTPKPVLHQGVPTGFEEVEAGAASRANEVLMRVAGMFPKEGAEVGVAVQIPNITVELTSRKTETVDAEVVDVDVSVPEQK